MLAIGISRCHSQSSPDARTGRVSILIVFRDGHQESFVMSEIARIEFTDAGAFARGARLFSSENGRQATAVVGISFIKLEPNGEASRSIGTGHGIWTVVGDGSTHQLGTMAGMMSYARSATSMRSWLLRPVPHSRISRRTSPMPRKLEP